MEINWLFIGILAICIVILIFNLIKQNKKEEEKLTKFLNHNFDSPKKEESDSDDDY